MPMRRLGWRSINLATPPHPKWFRKSPMKTQRNGRDAEERQIKLLLVGSGDELNHDAARQLLSGNRLEIAGRSPNLLGALECLRSETIDLVLLGSEFRDE